jgi:hypothetical protein
LDVVAGGDFLHYGGDQAFNIIKKLIAVYSLTSDFDSSLVSIFARLNTLETHTACLKECYGTLREHHDFVPIISESSSWFPTVKSLSMVKLFMLVVILCLNFSLCLRMFMNL